MFETKEFHWHTTDEMLQFDFEVDRTKLYKVVPFIGGTKGDRNAKTIEKIKNGFTTLPLREAPVYSRVSRHSRFVKYKFVDIPLERVGHSLISSGVHNGRKAI